MVINNENKRNISMYKQANPTPNVDSNDANNPLPAALMLGAIGGVAGLGGSLLSKKQRKHKLRNTLLGATALPAAFLAANKWGPEAVKGKLNDFSGSVYKGYEDYIKDRLPKSMSDYIGSQSVNTNKEVTDATTTAREKHQNYKTENTAYNTAKTNLENHKPFEPQPIPDETPYTDRKEKAKKDQQEADEQAVKVRDDRFEKDPRRSDTYKQRQTDITTNEGIKSDSEKKLQEAKNTYQQKGTAAEDVYNKTTSELVNPYGTKEYNEASQRLSTAKKERENQENMLDETRRQRAFAELEKKYGPDSNASPAEKEAYRRFLDFQSTLQSQITAKKQELQNATLAKSLADSNLTYYLDLDAELLRDQVNSQTNVDKRIKKLNAEIEALSKRVYNPLEAVTGSGNYQNALAQHSDETAAIKALEDLVKLKNTDPNLVAQLEKTDKEVARTKKVLDTIIEDRNNLQIKRDNARNAAEEELNKGKQAWLDKHRRTSLTEEERAQMLMQQLEGKPVIDPTSEKALEAAWTKYFNENLPGVEKRIRNEAETALKDSRFSKDFEKTVQKNLDKAIANAIGTKKTELSGKREALSKILAKEQEQLKAEIKNKQAIIENLQKPMTSNGARRSYNAEIQALKLQIAEDQNRIEATQDLLTKMTTNGNEALRQLSPELYKVLDELENQLKISDDEQLGQYTANNITPIESEIQKMYDDFYGKAQEAYNAREATNTDNFREYSGTSELLERAVLDATKKIEDLKAQRDRDDALGADIIESAGKNYYKDLANNKATYDTTVKNIDDEYAAAKKTVEDANKVGLDAWTKEQNRLQGVKDKARTARDTAQKEYDASQKKINPTKKRDAIFVKTPPSQPPVEALVL